MTVDNPDLLAAKRLLNLPTDHGFSFQRVVPGEDGPLLSRRQTIAMKYTLPDSVTHAALSGDAVAERITGDVLTCCMSW